MTFSPLTFVAEVGNSTSNQARRSRFAYDIKDVVLKQGLLRLASGLSNLYSVENGTRLKAATSW